MGHEIRKVQSLARLWKLLGFKIMNSRRDESKWQSRRMQNSPPHTNTSRTHLQMDQFS